MAKDVAEGWDWGLIGAKACPQCGYDPSSLPVPDLGGQAVEQAVEWSTFLAGADLAYLRTSPAPGVWSPAQYALHVRDMLAVFGQRIVLGINEDDPEVPWFDPGEDGWRAYNQVAPDEIAAEVAGAAQTFATTVQGTGPGDWSRTVRRDGTESFTVAGLACFGVHEAYHHLLDANGELAERLEAH